MGPGGWADWGSPSVQYMGGQVGLFQEPLTREEKAVLFAATTLVAGPYAIMRGGAGLTAALWRARLIIAAGMGFGISSSLGGGGPGQSPISTNSPLSLEATGAILEQLGKPGGPASGSKRRSRPRRKKCPPGFRWSRRLQTCIFSDKPKGYSKVWRKD